jgi:hypothetical protein
MSRELDNWSLGLVVVGFIQFLFLWNTLRLYSLSIGLFMSFFGLIVGIISLVKGGNKKWKSILAIILFILTIPIYFAIFLGQMSLAWF